MGNIMNLPNGWTLPVEAIDRVAAAIVAEPIAETKQRWDGRCAAAFGKVKEQWGRLSNMANGMGFTDPATGLAWKSSEAWYQAQRFPALADHREAIRNAGHAFLAKQVAYERIAESRDDWQKQDGANPLNVAMMARALALKATTPGMIDALRETGDRPIVEKSWRDGYWGARPEGSDLVGANVLGQLLMRLRDQLAKEAGAPDEPTPRPSDGKGGRLAAMLGSN